MHGAFEGALPDGWQGGAPVTKYWKGDYLHLYRVTRPCGTCAAMISIDVSKKALQGFSKNAGLLLRNCPTCRAARKAGGPGSRGGTSRPTAVGAPQAAAPVAPAVDNAELEKLRAELKEAWEAHAELSKGLAGLRKFANEAFGLSYIGDAINYESVAAAYKVRLAQYELAPAMDAIKTELERRLENNSNTFPWGVDSP